MRRTPTSSFAMVLAASLVLLSSCGQEQASTDSRPPSGQAMPSPSDQTPATAEPFLVSRIDLGTAVDAANRVTDPKTVFKPTDTVYASVVSDGTLPTVTIVAAWTSADQMLVGSSSQVSMPQGPSVTEFHLAPPGGWKAGKYEVHLFISTGVELVRSFEVQE